MPDYLKGFCNNLGINLVYTYNKVTLLSCTTPRNKPTIRVHNIFRNCSETVARAIVDYYTNSKYRDKNYKLITNYIEKKFHSSRYKIKNPKNEFKDLVINRMDSITSWNNTTPNTQGDSSLVELNIISMTKRNFKGEFSEVDPKGTLDLKGEGIINLDIFVDG